MEAAEHKAEKPKKNHGEHVQLNKGDVEAALATRVSSKIEQTYITPTETHNPIEMSGTIAHWEWRRKADALRCDAIRERRAEHRRAAHSDWNCENVRVICPFVGGAFGCKGAVWLHVFLAAMGSESRRRSGEGSRPAPEHVYRHRTSHADAPDDFARRDARRKIAGDAARERHARLRRSANFTESCGARSTGVMYDEPGDPGRGNGLSGERRHADIHARARRMSRHVCARMRDG